MQGRRAFNRIRQTRASRMRAVEMEARRRLGTGSSEWVRMADATARWWLGKLWAELGDEEEAARCFRSLWRDPPAEERLRDIASGAPPGRALVSETTLARVVQA